MQQRGSHVGRPFRVPSRILERHPARRCLGWTLTAPLLVIAVVAGCGKKGPPLPPLVRIPEAVAVVGTRRSGSDAFITVRVPARNIDGSTPVDFAAVELLALTADRPPTRAVFLEQGTTVASIPVTLPPPRPDTPLAAAATGPSPGDQVTVRETLTDQMFVPVALPGTPVEPPREKAAAAATGPGPAPAGAPASPSSRAVSADPPEPRRYYMAFTRDARKRPGPSATVASVSLAPLPEAPGGLRVTFTEQMVTVVWSAVPGAAGYNVYGDASASPTPTPAAAPAPAQGIATVPTSLNAAPLEMATYSEAVRFGELACYRVRAVRGHVAALIEGPASPPVCERPTDSFPPAPPGDIRAVPARGEITVEWVANTDADLAGYVVLRGSAGDDTLQPITDAPIRETQFVDRNVTPGVRYAYAVVAVDTAANRSAASMRYEATAR